MDGMNPFDLPPASPPVSLDPPAPGGEKPPRRRGRMALVALAAAGLVGGGIVGVSQFVSADRPEIESADQSLSAIDGPGDDETDDSDDETDDGPDDGDGDGDGDGPIVGGEIVIDIGDGEPIVIELDGDDDGRFLEFHECVGLPIFGDGQVFDFDLDGEGFPFQEWDEAKIDEFLEGLPLGELDGSIFGEFGSFELGGTHVTVVGPDGVTVVELGDGDGSVTITKDGDEVTITTDGDASVEELPDLFDDRFLDGRFLDELFGEDFDPEARLDELFGEDFDPEALFDEFFAEFGTDADQGELGRIFQPPAELEECIDALHDD
jgi:hypothetical protein